ncbi:MAG: hypothetical protein EPO51_16430 [Phenylobacterium sp.]|uniref:hypothetical protein n=1 Tax=Phenylobacterium sp. TaxID=1871053 RepID=UPI0012109903|nr:hypothetical protein [Phenylobacterium sp.]TAJ70677.1 MAG: hypothetical protein EPO51_16430 [Phenylobacterium sp.]
MAGPQRRLLPQRATGLLKWPDHSGVYCRSEPRACRLYPERFLCSMTDCIFLFARPSDGALVEVVAYGDAPGNFRFHLLRRAGADALRDLRADYVIAKPAPKGRPPGPADARPRPDR